MSTSRSGAAAALLVIPLAVSLLVPAAADESDPWHQYRSVATNNTVVTTDLDDLHAGSYATANEVRATPVVAAGAMFVGNHDTGELQSFDLTDGSLQWESRAPNWVHSEMIHDAGRVYVGFGNRFFQDNGLRGTGDSGVLALDATTGEELWRHDTAGEVMPTPVLVDGSLYAVTGDRHLYELDPDTGTELARTSIGHTVSMSSPAVADDVVYFGGGSPRPFTFFAYDTRAKNFRWQHEMADVASGLDDVPPAVADGVVVTTANRAMPEDSAGERREEHVIVAMDANDGEVLWQQDIGIGPNPTNNRSGAPMIDEGRVFVGSPTTGRSYAYDLHTGELLWSFASGAVKGAPVATDGTVFFATTDGMVHARSTDTGERRAEHELDGVLAPAGPIIVDDHLVVGSQSANVHIVPLSEILGTERPWQTWVVGGALALTVALVILFALLSRPARANQGAAGPNRGGHTGVKRGRSGERRPARGTPPR